MSNLSDKELFDASDRVLAIEDGRLLIIAEDSTPPTIEFERAWIVVRREGEYFRVLKDRYGSTTGGLVPSGALQRMLEYDQQGISRF